MKEGRVVLNTKVSHEKQQPPEEQPGRAAVRPGEPARAGAVPTEQEKCPTAGPATLCFPKTPECSTKDRGRMISY